MASKPSSQSDLRGVDWDFADSSGSANLGGFHWYPGRFIAEVPGVLIAHLAPPGGVVLDPFCGSGTTLLEARRFGRSSIGIDINPAACLIADAKLTRCEPAAFDAWSEAILKRVRDAVDGFGWDDLTETNRSIVPNFEENSRWYHPRTLFELASLWIALAEDPEETFRAVGRAAFSSILLGSCSQDRDWGWVCDNVVPKSLVEKNAVERFSRALISWREGQLRLQATTSSVAAVTSDVICGDAASVLMDFPEAHFDAVVTSPPYLNMTDYVRSQRLSFLWFEEWDLNAARQAEIGARYKRSRRASLDQFIGEMTVVISEVARVLKRGGNCAMVAGESPHYEEWIERLEVICENSGLTVQQRLDRMLPKQRAKRPVLQGETVIVMRRE